MRLAAGARRDATRASIALGRIGFAGAYLVQAIAPEAARARKHADQTRSRRNFERHLRLQPALLAWYRALAIAFPCRVHFQWPAQLPSLPPIDAGDRSRYAVAGFDAMLAALDVEAAALRASEK
jgi:hypothetical protein